VGEGGKKRVLDPSEKESAIGSKKKAVEERKKKKKPVQKKTKFLMGGTKKERLRDTPLAAGPFGKVPQKGKEKREKVQKKGGGEGHCRRPKKKKENAPLARERGLEEAP